MSERRRAIDTIKREIADIRSNIDLNIRDVTFVADAVAYTPPSPPRTFSPTQGFGVELVPPSEMLFASQREPVIKWLVYWVASDIFDNWFKVIDPKKPEDDALDRAVQWVLLELNAKEQLTRLIQFERRYGTSIMLCAYTDMGDDDWDTSIYNENGGLNGPRKLLQITPYPWTKITVNANDKDTEMSSLRYGWPVIYQINRGDNINPWTAVHWSRIIHAATRIDEEVRCPFEGLDQPIGGTPLRRRL